MKEVLVPVNKSEQEIKLLKILALPQFPQIDQNTKLKNCIPMFSSRTLFHHLLTIN